MVQFNVAMGTKTIGASIGIFLFAVMSLPAAAIPAQKHIVSSVQSGKARPVVIELFTSQGCSSCPAADRVFEKFTDRADVIALGFHVDYWDYLGWKDEMASPVNSARQRAYAIQRGDGSVYTPQVIVGGQKSVIGHNEGAINTAITEAAQMQATSVDVRLWEKKKSLFIEIGEAPEGMKAKKGTVWLALIKKTRTVNVKRGENRGRKLAYHNIVHELSPVGRWMGKKMKLRLPRKHWMQRGSDGCVVLLQNDDGTGKIWGAAQMASW